jgi:hypothetical protein
VCKENNKWENVGYVLYSLHEGFGGSRGPSKKFFFGPTYFRRFRATYFRDHMILGGFRHMVFADGFLFPVKELGFWTNPGHWVRVLDVAGSYMYIVL